MGTLACLILNINNILAIVNETLEDQEMIRMIVFNYRVSQKECYFCQVLSFLPWEGCFLG